MGIVVSAALVASGSVKTAVPFRESSGRAPPISSARGRPVSDLHVRQWHTRAIDDRDIEDGEGLTGVVAYSAHGAGLDFRWHTPLERSARVARPKHQYYKQQDSS